MASQSSSAEFPQQNRKQLHLPKGPPRLATVEQLQAVIQQLGRALGHKIEFIGADRVEVGVDRVSVKLPKGGTLEERPWMVKKLESGNFGITGGSYNSITIENTELPDDETLWVYIEATWDLEVTSGYVQSAELTSATLETGASVPANSPGTATFYVPLAKVTNGRLETQSATRAISATVCDSGANDGTAQHNVLQS